MPKVPTATRPRLTSQLTATEFASWYWLKSELTAFCQRHKLSTSGSKPDLESRIIAHLSGERTAQIPAITRRQAIMPKHFTLDTVIGAGWRCGPSLGAFFKQHLGPDFHFNAAMRDCIHNGSGRTLADAAHCYQASIRPGAKRPVILPQLEYNQHFRQYFRDHPGASRDEAIAAWWKKRSQRKNEDIRDR